MYIAEQTGAIKRATFEDGAWHPDGTFLDLTDLVIDPRDGGNGERGLLGLAFHPDYERNGRFYVDYTRRGSGGAHGDTVVAEYRRGSDGRGDPGRAPVPSWSSTSPTRTTTAGTCSSGRTATCTSASATAAAAAIRTATGSAWTRCSASCCASTRSIPMGPAAEALRASRAPIRSSARAAAATHLGLGPAQPLALLVRPAQPATSGSATSARARSRRSTARASTATAATPARPRTTAGTAARASGRYPQTSRSVPLRYAARARLSARRGRCSVTGGYVHRGPPARRWRGLYVGADFCGRLFVLGPKGGTRLSRNSGLNISTFGEDPAGRIFAADLTAVRIYLVRFVGPRP